jgi:hypothetical protein
MPPYCISVEELGKIYDTIENALIFLENQSKKGNQT